MRTRLLCRSVWLPRAQRESLRRDGHKPCKLRDDTGGETQVTIDYRKFADQTAAGQLHSKWHEIAQEHECNLLRDGTGPRPMHPVPQGETQTCVRRTDCTSDHCHGRLSRDSKNQVSIEYGQRADGVDKHRPCTVVEHGQWSDGSVEPRKLPRVISSSQPNTPSG